MAKVVGGAHSDFVKGTISGTTFRGYRGQNIVSCSRRITRAKSKLKLISSLFEITSLWARYSADKAVTKRVSGSKLFVSNWGDQKGGAGNVEQSTNFKQPEWIAADPSYDGRPYVISDGIDDFLLGQTISMPLGQPFEIWMVASEPIMTGADRYMVSLSTSLLRGIWNSAQPVTEYKMEMTAPMTVGYKGDGSVKVWRCVFNQATSWMEWNGQPQTAVKNIGLGSLGKVGMFSLRGVSKWAGFKLFEMDVFNAILSGTDRNQVLNWLFRRYGLPG